MKLSLRDLLSGFDGDASQVERIIKSNARAEGIKILLDDGDENCFVPKKRLDAKIDEITKLKESLGDVDEKQLKTLIADKEKLENKVKEYEEKIKTNNLATHMKALADEFKSQDPTGMDLLNFIDREKIVYKEDGTVEGIKEQVSELVKNKAYLFGANNQQQNNNPLEGLYQQQQQQPTPGQGGTGLPGNANFANIMNNGQSKEGIFGENLFNSTHSQNSEKDYYFGH